MKTEAEVEATIAEVKKTERKAMFKVFSVLPWFLLVMSIIIGLGYQVDKLGKDRKIVLEEAIRIDSERNELIREAIAKGYGEMGNKGFNWIIIKCPEIPKCPDCPICPTNSPNTKIAIKAPKAPKVIKAPVKPVKSPKVTKAIKGGKSGDTKSRVEMGKEIKEGKRGIGVEKGFLVGQGKREEVVHRIVEGYNGKIIDLNKFEQELNNGLKELEKDEGNGKLQEM